MKLLELSLAFLFRTKVRTFLAVSALIVAFALAGALDTVRLAFASDNDPVVPRLVVTALRSLNEGLPLSASSVFSRLGVDEKHLAWANWVGGYDQEPSAPIANIAISLNYFRLYPELRVSKQTLSRFSTTRNAVVVGKQLALDHHWTVGQQIRLLGVPYQAKDALDSGWSYVMAGVFEVADSKLKALENQFFSRWDYFDAMALYGHGQVGWFVVDAGSAANQNGLATAIDGATANSPNPTRSQTEQAFQRQMADRIVNLGWMITGLMGFAVVFVLVLTGKVMAHSIHESRREIGILKTLGFSARFLFVMLIAQSIMLVLASAALGLAMATIAVMVLRESAGLGALLQPVSARAWLDASAAAVIAGILVAIVPSLRASRASPSHLLGG